jgi:glycosyltransferase involved in cell wall biosynthesis
MRVLMITQRLDERDWLVSVIPRWVNALAQQVEHLDVVALEVGDYAPPANVHVYSMGKERGYGKFGKTLGFYRAMIPLIGKSDAVFVHMIPRYAILAAPLAWVARKPISLWYTHRNPSLQLRIALRFCRRVMTAAPDSFPLQTDKLRVLGHGIDTDFYAPPPPLYAMERGPGGEVEECPIIVHVARLMPIKHQATLLRAAASGIEAQTVVIGDVPSGQSRAYLEELEALARDLGLAVTFTGGLPAEAVRDWYRRAAVAVNLSPPGLFDKAVLESMAVGVPTIVSSPAFDPLLGEYAPRLRIDSPDDVEGLAARLRALLALPSEERATMTADIRARVRAAHSLEHLMPRLVNVLKTGEPDGASVVS